jgi:hypothetical protein
MMQGLSPRRGPKEPWNTRASRSRRTEPEGESLAIFLEGQLPYIVVVDRNSPMPSVRTEAASTMAPR